MAVKILESCMLTPSEPTPHHRLWLSDLDLLVARALTPSIYIYHPTSDKDFFSPDVLKAAMSKALVPFYPLAGRLAQDDSGRPEIQCNGEGVLFVTARADTTLHDLGDLAPSDKLRRMLFPSADPGAPGPFAGILAVFQVTFFACGGVCVGVAVHHMVTDGIATVEFVNAWAAIARGDVGVLEASRCLDRTLLRARSPPAVCFDHAEYSWLAGGNNPGGESKPHATVECAILPLSREQVEALRDDAGHGHGQGKMVSTFNAVVAHVWRCACMARGLAGTVDTRLYLTANARSRLHPPLPARYLGNAIFRTSAVATVDAVTSGPLDAVADKVTGATARLDDDYVRSLLDYMNVQAVGAAGPAKGPWVVPETDLWVVSWRELPIYSVDFGWGRPAFMGRASFKFGGIVYLMPRVEGDGRLDVVVAMESHSLARFREIFYQDSRIKSML